MLPSHSTNYYHLWARWLHQLKYLMLLAFSDIIVQYNGRYEVERWRLCCLMDSFVHAVCIPSLSVTCAAEYRGLGVLTIHTGGRRHRYPLTVNDGVHATDDGDPVEERIVVDKCNSIQVSLGVCFSCTLSIDVHVRDVFSTPATICLFYWIDCCKCARMQDTGGEMSCEKSHKWNLYPSVTTCDFTLQ